MNLNSYVSILNMYITKFCYNVELIIKLSSVLNGFIELTFVAWLMYNKKLNLIKLAEKTRVCFPNCCCNQDWKNSEGNVAQIILICKTSEIFFYEREHCIGGGASGANPIKSSLAF
jgi:hypothetical protein